MEETLLPGRTACLICFNEFTDDDYMECGNGCKMTYHISCMEDWRRIRNECPTCHRPMSPLQTDDENLEVVEQVETHVVETTVETVEEQPSQCKRTVSITLTVLVGVAWFVLSR